MSRSDGQTRLTTFCIKTRYGEPTRAESREGSSTLAKSSWVMQCAILLGCRSSWCSILIGCRAFLGGNNVLIYGIVRQGNKIGYISAM